SGAYLPYMVTGDYYYMSELAFGASYNEIYPNEGYRGFSRGLIDRPYGQVRGKAWVLREMADAAYLLPDHHPLQAEFTADVENSLADWNAKYSSNPNANPLGVMDGGSVYSVNGGTRNGVAPWQHNFLTWSAGHAADLGFAGAAKFRNWLAKFEIGLMTDWQTNSAQGYCWLQASAYSIQVKDALGNWLPSYTAVYGASWPTLAGLACNSPAMLTELAKVRNQPTQAGEMSGYPYSNTGYPANFQIGVAVAADSGLPNAQTAWTLFDSRSVKPSGSTAYNNYPNFAVMPRFVPYAAVDPIPVEPVPVEPVPVEPAPVEPAPVDPAPSPEPAPSSPPSKGTPPADKGPKSTPPGQSKKGQSSQQLVSDRVLPRSGGVLNGAVAFSNFGVLLSSLSYAFVAAVRPSAPVRAPSPQRSSRNRFPCSTWACGSIGMVGSRQFITTAWPRPGLLRFFRASDDATEVHTPVKFAASEPATNGRSRRLVK
ncbi:MAG TPA: hypothetical protein VL017_12775, partial [Devosia sp.]|nr:hypothetical protein [Devosia sp.]